MFRNLKERVKKWSTACNKQMTDEEITKEKTLSGPAYESQKDALKATDEFYENYEGFQYSEQKVTEWVRKHVKLPRSGRVIDLCCGDGIWSKGIQNINPKLELYGIDISQGAIVRARKLLDTDEKHFIIGDAEAGLPFRDGFFNLIFARGPGLYNQHNMDRPATIRVIESWHLKLAPDGIFYSVFASKPEKMGTYTPVDEVKLPYNRYPRKTDTIDFLGGKYHHTIQSFLSPFWKTKNVAIVSYSFFENLHVLVTRLRED